VRSARGTPELGGKVELVEGEKTSLIFVLDPIIFCEESDGAVIANVDKTLVDALAAGTEATGVVDTIGSVNGVPTVGENVGLVAINVVGKLWAVEVTV